MVEGCDRFGALPVRLCSIHACSRMTCFRQATTPGGFCIKHKCVYCDKKCIDYTTSVCHEHSCDIDKCIN